MSNRTTLLGLAETISDVERAIEALAPVVPSHLAQQHLAEACERLHRARNQIDAATRFVVDGPVVFGLDLATGADLGLGGQQ